MVMKMSNQPQQLDVEAILAEAERATKGPWEVISSHDGTFYVDMGFQRNSLLPDSSSMGSDDAIFIVSARTNVPALCREVLELRKQLADRDAELGDEIAFNEGWQEHISDLLDAMKPFVLVVKESSGRIPVESLSFANWHQLSKAFDAAVAALNAGKES